MNLEKHHVVIYIIIAIIILLGYVVSGTLLLLLQDSNMLRTYFDPDTRILVISYLWGVVGGNCYSFEYFAKETNAHREGQEAHLPNFIEPFGYLLFIIFSGFTGSLLLALVHVCFVAAYNSTHLETISEFAVAVIAFVGGLSAKRVQCFCCKLSENMLRDVHKTEKNSEVEADAQN